MYYTGELWKNKGKNPGDGFGGFHASNSGIYFACWVYTAGISAIGVIGSAIGIAFSSRFAIIFFAAYYVVVKGGLKQMALFKSVLPTQSCC